MNLQQYSKWAKPVISFHAGLVSKEHFVIEEDIYEVKSQVDEVKSNINELTNAVAILKNNVIQQEYIIDSESLASDILEYEELIKNNLDESANLKIDIISLDSQVKLAESIVNELDKDYIFSVENMSEGSIECPTCGTIHENSIAHRSSILIDKESAERQLFSLKNERVNAQRDLTHLNEMLSKLKEKLLNSQLAFESSNSKEFSTFTANNVDKQVDIIIEKKSVVLETKEIEERNLKKTQKALITKEQRDTVKENFSNTFFKYIAKLKVNIDASLITSPLDYNKIYEVGGAAEDARAVLGYYLALYEHIAEHCCEAIPPLVIDTPNQQEQSTENYKKIVEAISGRNDVGIIGNRTIREQVIRVNAAMPLFLALSKRVSPLIYLFVEYSKKRLNQPKNLFLCSCPSTTGFNIVAQSAGVKISATITERAIAETIVIENCR